MSETTNTNQFTDEKKTIVPQGNNDVLKAFKHKFASTTNIVYVNSLNRDVAFREITVVEQKNLSKTMIENENRKDIVYDVQCQLINNLCNEEGFSIYRLTEFDRIKILMEIYQSNYFNNTITYKCSECGCENSYKIDFNKYSNKMKEFDLKDIVFSCEDKHRYYNFTLNYPTVRNVSEFYKMYIKNYKNVTSKERQVLDDMGNIEYINLFIKGVEVVDKIDTTDKLYADLTLMSYSDVTELISTLPQDILFSEEHGVLRYVTKEFIEKIGNVFQYEKCAQCGAENQGEGIGSVIDFF